jgi:sodium/potassium-transporting ATPase subunit alpha
VGLVVSGNIMDKLSETDWFQIINHDELIFARTSPLQKLEIVNRAQSFGHIVAVTGDGVNDSAALKKADLGISMNLSASAISKECARMILLDDKFEGIIEGIKEGRLMFINLKKAVKYSLSHIVAEVLPYLFYVLVPIPLAITPTQILAIDLGFELLLTLSYAWEPAEDDSMLLKVPPRRKVTEESSKAYHELSKSIEQRESEKLNLLSDQPEDFYSNTNLTDDENIKMLGSKLKSKYAIYFEEMKQFLTKRSYWIAQYHDWKRVIAKSDGERLLDSEVMLWSFLEAGVIVMIGSFCTYYAVFWFSFGMTVYDVSKSERSQSLYYKPTSPSFKLESGGSLVFKFDAVRTRASSGSKTSAKWLLFIHIYYSGIQFVCL